MRTRWVIPAVAIVALGVALPARAEPPAANFAGADLLVSLPSLADAAALAGVSAAIGETLVGQSLVGNHVDLVDPVRQSAIEQSFQNNRGIVSVNQDSGDVNNQANIRIIALSLSGGFVDLQSTGVAQRSGNTLITSGGSSEDRIAGSFGGTTGLVGVNQSSGSLNQQFNVMMIGLGVTIDPTSAQLGDSLLATVNGGAANSLQEGTPRPRSDSIDGSFAGFHGAAQVSQSAGDLNAIGQTMAISVIQVNLP